MEEESESNEEELIDEVPLVVSHKYAMEMFDKSLHRLQHQPEATPYHISTLTDPSSCKTLPLPLSCHYPPPFYCTLPSSCRTSGTENSISCATQLTIGQVYNRSY